MSDTTVMTYHEIAAWRGISLPSARKYAQKKRWTRTQGNDGQARIQVPNDVLEAPTAISEPIPAPVVEDNRIYTRELELRIEGMRELLTSVEADRDAWKAQAQRSILRQLFG